MTGIQATLGSSPHTRGALSAASFNTPKTRDHPRIRGEHRLYLCNRWNNHGIIPAYAGSTTSLSSKLLVSLGSSPHTRGAHRCDNRRQQANRDHPRIRGEHHKGSEHRRFWNGIIPAYAGSTPWVTLFESWDEGSSPHTRGAPPMRARRRRCHRDHPRIRGEHGVSLALLRLPAGIIPAYAGSTSSEISIATWPGDHPRIRGEHSITLVTRYASLGSSPHTRGAHVLETCTLEFDGIIPAYAGSTRVPTEVRPT